jgi:GAF domain-containing protein
MTTTVPGWGSPANIRKELQRTQQELQKAQLKLERYRATLRLAGTNIERRNRVIRALTSFPYQAGRMTEPAALLKLGLTQALEMTEAQVGAIVIIDPGTKELAMGAHEGLSPELVRILTGKQLDAGAATLMPHLVAGTGALIEESETADEGERMLLTAAQVSSLISLPLFAGEQLLGSLVAGTVGEIRFSPASTHFLIAIAQGIAIALESLRLRERLWYMAEIFLSQAASAPDGLGAAQEQTDVPPPPLLPPLQAQLADLVASLGGTMGAVFFMDKLKEDLQITLAADYGLSPIFTNEYAQFRNSYAFFPFHQLFTHNMLVKNLARLNASQPMPLLKSLQEEGAKSLMAAYFSDPEETKLRVLMVAATKTAVFTASQFDDLLNGARELLPLLSEAPAVPTLPTRSVHVPSMTLEAKEGDLELLLAAMMEAEEEVQRHNADFATLNDISEMLVQSLELGPVLEKVVRQIRQMLQTDAAWLYLVEDVERPWLRLLAAEGLSDVYLEKAHHLSFHDTLEGTAATENKASHLNDISQEPDLCRQMHQMEQIQSVAVVPLSCPEIVVDGQVHRRVVGVLAVAMRQSHTWQPRQIRLLNTVTNQMGFAINNAQLYAQVRENMEAFSLSNQFLKQVNDALMGI